ncbi:MAG: sulfite exporter TauE/SafE family protein [Arcobacteraceae bacterium]|nr:sulfite exporter TauE/SafE family protein [Arcobacteraceae bacterium]
MIEYILYFFLTIILSSVFAIAGVGSAIALVPTFHFAGLSFDISRASGLFVNFITTVTTSYLNFKKKLFDKEFILPLVISSVVFAFIGAKISLEMDVEIVKNVFATTLLVVATLMIFKVKTISNNIKLNKSILYIVGSIGGFFSGFLGVGGGSIISPILILCGYDPKKIAISISFVIPFSSLVAFYSYATVIQIDYLLLAVVGVGALIGGMIGNYLLHFKVSSKTIKKILAVVLYLLAIKILFS